MIKVEPYWNVKLIHGQFSFSDSSIKVEPYWNVKMNKVKEFSTSNEIKVEPYWNVKYISETNAPIAYLLK